MACWRNKLRAFGRPLEMLTQDAAYRYSDAQAVYRDFGGVVLTQEEGDRIGAALGTHQGKGMILQNHGLLTVGSTVDEACFLMTLVECACQTQLLAEAAAAKGLAKVYVPEKNAKYTFENSSDPETLYWEGQPDLQYEEYMSKGEHRGC
ncbi:class II aldolase/adducin N-terminal [Lipomyces doorenjongii]|uniref:class II aldolase/adducin N-terminal n=1 Tax=Lipomyces doorenjongii TaxID=383834 RepID=UPI0034CD24B6